MTTQTRTTMTRVAMRAAIWSWLDSQTQRSHDDAEIDALTNVAVNAVLDVAEQHEQRNPTLSHIIPSIGA